MTRRVTPMIIALSILTACGDNRGGGGGGGMDSGTAVRRHEPCESKGDCPFMPLVGQSCGPAGFCTECFGDADCLSNVCDEASQLCQDCGGTADCGGRSCLPSGDCECEADTDCPADLPP